MMLKNYKNNVINCSEFPKSTIERVKNNKAVIFTDDAMAYKIVDSPNLRISRDTSFTHALAFPVRRGFRLKKMFNSR